MSSPAVASLVAPRHGEWRWGGVFLAIFGLVLGVTGALSLATPAPPRASASTLEPAFFSPQVRPALDPPVVDSTYVEFFDNLTGVRCASFLPGDGVRARLTARSAGNTTEVRVSLALDRDADDATAPVYDGTPAGDAIGVLNRTATLDFPTFTLPLTAPVGPYYYRLVFRDRTSLAVIHQTGWQHAAIRVASSPPAGWSPMVAGQYFLMGTVYQAVEYDGEREILVVDRGPSGNGPPKVIPESAELAMVLTYDAIVRAANHYTINQPLLQEQAWLAERDKWDALSRETNAARYISQFTATHPAWSDGSSRTSVLAAGTISGATGGPLLGGATTVRTGGNAAMLGTNGAGFAAMRALTETFAGLPTDKFMAKEYVEELKSLEYLYGGEGAQRGAEAAAERAQLQQYWQAAGLSFQEIDDRIGQMRTAVALSYGAMEPLTSTSWLDLVTRFMQQGPIALAKSAVVTATMNEAMDPALVRLRLEQSRNRHFRLLRELADKLSNHYHTVAQYGAADQRLSLAMLQQLNAIVIGEQQYRRVRAELALSEWQRAQRYRELGSPQATDELTSDGVAALKAEYEAVLAEVRWYDDLVVFDMEWYVTTLGRIKTSLAHAGAGPAEPPLAFVSYLASRLDAAAASATVTTQITLLNGSGATLKVSGIQSASLIAPALITASTAMTASVLGAGAGAVWDVALSPGNPGALDTAFQQVTLEYRFEAAGAQGVGFVPLSLRLAPPFAATLAMADRTVVDRGDRVQFAARLDSRTGPGHFILVPKLVFLDTTIVLPSVPVTLNAGASTAEARFAWTVPADALAGTYGLWLQLEADGMVSETPFARLFTVLPPLYRHTLRVPGSTPVIISARVDQATAGGLARATGLPLVYDEDLTPPAIDEFKRGHGLVLVGGQDANPLVGELLAAGKLIAPWAAANAGEGTASVEIVAGWNGHSATVIGGRPPDDTFFAGLQYLKSAGPLPEFRSFLPIVDRARPAGGG